MNSDRHDYVCVDDLYQRLLTVAGPINCINADACLQCLWSYLLKSVASEEIEPSKPILVQAECWRQWILSLQVSFISTMTQSCFVCKYFIEDRFLMRISSNLVFHEYCLKVKHYFLFKFCNFFAVFSMYVSSRWNFNLLSEGWKSLL